MRDSFRLRSMLAAAGVAVILAGCAQSGGGGGTTPAPTQVAVAPSEAAQGSPEVYTVALANNASLGMILTGDDGKTLYVFNKDSNGTTACTGGCASTWPPFTLDDGETAVPGTGVTGTIGTFTRPDGSTQVTINGKPLYYFSGDKAAGDANGEGFNNLWYAAGADGSAVQPAAPSSSAGGYHY